MYLQILFQKNKLTFLVLAVLFVVTLGIIVFSLLGVSEQTNPSTLSPYLKTVAGSTSANEVEGFQNRLRKTTRTDGSVQHEFASMNKLRPHIIITEKGKVVFEKAITVDDMYTHPKISDFITRYGSPEAKMQGSKLYGPFETYFLYPSRGFVVVGNPFTDEVDEIQTFTPLSLEGYRQKWGEDISPQGNPQEGLSR